MSDIDKYGKKRIGIATNWNYHDYGGMLQAFATQAVLDGCGFDVEVIDARPLGSAIARRKMLYFVRNAYDLSIVHEKSAIVATKLREKLSSRFGEDMRRRDEAFDAFCDKHFRPSTPAASWEALSELSRTYNTVLVGSDQLWLPSNISADYYTLSFVPDGVQKVAYATSFGVSKIPDYLVEKTGEYLNRFDHLSAREHSGQKIIHECSGIEAPLVCDPTLLIDTVQWRDFSNSDMCPDDPYIFCYLMGDNPWQRSRIREIAQLTGFKVVALLHLDRFIKTDESFPDYAPYDASPAHFLGLVANASLVCTDSFHGTIFAAKFGTPFLVFRRFAQNATLSTNTRIDSLLDRLGVKDHLVGEDDSALACLDKSKLLNGVEPRIDAFRAESFDYLLGALR